MSKEVENISKGSSLDPTGILSQRLLGETENRTRETSVIRGVPAKVRTAYLENTSIQHRRCVLLLPLRLATTKPQLCERRSLAAVCHSACRANCRFLFRSGSYKCKGWRERWPFVQPQGPRGCCCTYSSRGEPPRLHTNDIKWSKATGEVRFPWWPQFSVKSAKPTNHFNVSLLEMWSRSRHELWSVLCNPLLLDEQRSLYNIRFTTLTLKTDLQIHEYLIIAHMFVGMQFPLTTVRCSSNYVHKTQNYNIFYCTNSQMLLNIMWPS